MTSLAISTYSNIYELSCLLKERAQINAIHDLALTKVHTAFSRNQLETDCALDELELLLKSGGVSDEVSIQIIEKLATIDDAIYATANMRGSAGSSYFITDSQTNHKREILQGAEKHIKARLRGEKALDDEYVISLIDIPDSEIKIANIPHKRVLFSQDLKEENSSVKNPIILRKLKNYIRQREKALEENAIKITEQNEEIILNDLKELADLAGTFYEYVLEVNPDDNEYPNQGKAAESELLQIIEDIKSCKIDFIRITSNGFGDTITIETYSRDN